MRNARKKKNCRRWVFIFACDTTSMESNTHWGCPSVNSAVQSLQGERRTNAENDVCSKSSMSVDTTAEVASEVGHQCLGWECVPPRLEVACIIFPVQGHLCIYAFKKLKYNQYLIYQERDLVFLPYFSRLAVLVLKIQHYKWISFFLTKKFITWYWWSFCYWHLFTMFWEMPKKLECRSVMNCSLYCISQRQRQSH